MEYVAETLGLSIKSKPWNVSGGLPMFIFENYDIQKVMLDDVSCLFVKPKNEMPGIPALKRHLEIIGEKSSLPRVAIVESINPRQRKALINAKLPFIVENTQIYLPFIGVALSERFSKSKTVPETLMPSAQMLLLYYLYQKKKELPINGMADKLKVSNMQITRAVNQLSALHLFTSHKDGVRIIISGAEEDESLFAKATPFLLNPVKKKLYIDKNTMPGNMPLSGLSALAEYSMLSEPDVPTYAYCGSVSGLRGTEMLVDYDQIGLEIWRYDPILLSGNTEVADPISVAISLRDMDDPRVEQAIDGIWRKKEWLKD